MQFIAIHTNSHLTTKRVIDAVLIDLLVNHDIYMSSLHSDHCQRQVLSTMCPSLHEVIFHGIEDNLRRSELYGLSIRCMLDRITKLGETINHNYWPNTLKRFMRGKQNLIVLSRDDVCLPAIDDCEAIVINQLDMVDIDYPWEQPPYYTITSRSYEDLAAPVTELKSQLLRLFNG